LTQSGHQPGSLKGYSSSHEDILSRTATEAMRRRDFVRAVLARADEVIE